MKTKCQNCDKVEILLLNTPPPIEVSECWGKKKSWLFLCLLNYQQMFKLNLNTRRFQHFTL